MACVSVQSTRDGPSCQGGSQCAKCFVGLTQLGGVIGGNAGIGTTVGYLMDGTSATAGAMAIVAIAVTTAAVVGYNVGTAISHAAGNCSKDDKSGGS